LGRRSRKLLLRRGCTSLPVRSLLSFHHLVNQTLPTSWENGSWPPCVLWASQSNTLDPLHVDLGETGVLGSGTVQRKRLAYGESVTGGMGRGLCGCGEDGTRSLCSSGGESALVLPFQGMVGGIREE
jgi:hypothetical protein